MEPSVITAIEPAKGRRGSYQVHFNNRESLLVHEDVLVRWQLAKDKTLTSAQITGLMENTILHEAYAYALRSLAVKAQSQLEMRRKLAGKQYSQEMIDQVIRKLLQHKYIDDREYAVHVSQYRIRSQKKGKKLAAMELKQKGVQEEHIRHALEQIQEDEAYRIVYELAVKKWNATKEADLLKKRQKVAGFLLRRGHARHDVFKALRELSHTTDEIEEIDFEDSD